MRSKFVMKMVLSTLSLIEFSVKRHTQILMKQYEQERPQFYSTLVRNPIISVNLIMTFNRRGYLNNQLKLKLFFIFFHCQALSVVAVDQKAHLRLLSCLKRLGYVAVAAQSMATKASFKAEVRIVRECFLAAVMIMITKIRKWLMLSIETNSTEIIKITI